MKLGIMQPSFLPSAKKIAECNKNSRTNVMLNQVLDFIKKHINKRH